ncbi:hypothetical protein PIB30_041620 [Stylosanthes scabra]|uniref:Uncharacterized protein n=1 Tax=Stylosanthes scabra TaxID=79078 RepID=A0ABU6XG84_9FABA|nr:hypothetical protein [Stylosanthes scabra]
MVRRASGEETRRKDSKDSVDVSHTGYVFGAWAKKMVSHSFSEDYERLARLEFFNKKLLVFDLDDPSREVLGRNKLGFTYKALSEFLLIVVGGIVIHVLGIQM